MIENDLVEAIIVMPRDMFYSTDISVTLWILNKNKKHKLGTQGGDSIKYRDRRNEVLFVDLRTKGESFEKKYIQLTEKDIKEVVTTYHSWQRDEFKTKLGNSIQEIYVHTTEIRGRENFHVNEYQKPTEDFIDIDTTNISVEECILKISTNKIKL